MLKRFGLLVVFAVALAGLFPTLAISQSNTPLSVIDPHLMPITFAAIPNNPEPNRVFDLVNKARQQAGSPPLRANQALSHIAQARVADMIAHQYFAHKSPEARYYYDFFPLQNVNPDYSCENLDLVIVPNAESFIQEWLGSTKGHRECLLNKQLVEAGYAINTLTTVDYAGHSTTAYAVVAIHTTTLSNQQQ